MNTISTALHNVGNLTLDSNLNKIAQKYAKNLAVTDTFAHSHTQGLGENISWASRSSSDDCASIIQ